MALDESSFDTLQETYFKIKEYLETTPLTREHSPLMLKHEELGSLLETFDVEALEEQTKDVHGLHAQLDTVTAISNQIKELLNDTSDTLMTIEKVVSALNEVFDKINTIVL